MLNRRRFLELCGLLALGGCENGGGEVSRLGHVDHPGSLTPVLSLHGDGFRVHANHEGAMIVEVGGESYAIESYYSYPGVKIGTNRLPSRRQQRDTWRVEIGRVGPNQIRITARGDFYTLTRTLSVEGHRIGISDGLVNMVSEAVGVVIHHRVRTADEPEEVLFAGAPWVTQGGIIAAGKDIVKQGALGLGLLTAGVGYSAENPTIFVSLKHSHLGVVAEDTLSRLQFEGHRNQAAFSMEHFALDRNETRTFRWAVYPLARDADYFTFINAVRRDWGTNFAVSGPWEFFDLIDQQEMLDQPARLKEYVERKRLQIIAFRPWLDYDNFNWRSGRTVSRSEYEQLMHHGMAAFKGVDPKIKCLGCMQSNLVSLPSEMARNLYEAILPERRVQGIHRFTDEQMQFVRELPWKDCLVTGPDGRYIYELYYNGPQRHPLLAAAVYASPGNAQFAYWMNQAKFILEKVGLDGIYVDQFSLAFKSDPSQRYSYDRWDGVTVDIDAATGKIARSYTDGAWMGVLAQKRLSDYVFSKSRIMVANTASSTEELQALPIMRFVEGSDVLNTFTFVEGQEPPIERHLSRGQLGSPIALGWRPQVPGSEEAGAEYSRKVMQAVITYLKHGLLYYHYGHFGLKFSEAGALAGEYGPISHMFPITPSHVGRGFIAGKERIVTCVSRTFSWQNERKPHILLFDISGRVKMTGVGLEKSGSGWKVGVGLQDWREVAVVE